MFCDSVNRRNGYWNGSCFSNKKRRKRVFRAKAGGGFVAAFGVAESPEGDGPYAYPAGGYFSVKKRTPRRRRRRGTEGRIWEKKVVN